MVPSFAICRPSLDIHCRMTTLTGKCRGWWPSYTPKRDIFLWTGILETGNKLLTVSWRTGSYVRRFMFLLSVISMGACASIWSIICIYLLHQVYLSNLFLKYCYFAILYKANTICRYVFVSQSFDAVSGICIGTCDSEKFDERCLNCWGSETLQNSISWIFNIYGIDEILYNFLPTLYLTIKGVLKYPAFGCGTGKSLNRLFYSVEFVDKQKPIY